MNLIIERMGDLIKPHVTQILHLLPGLWKAAEAEGQSLVRMQVGGCAYRLSASVTCLPATDSYPGTV
jgi:hypothetical protein